MFERKQKFKEMLQFATQLLSDPILNQAMNHIELAKFGFEQLGVDNTERFFNGAGQTGMGNIPINAGQGAMGVNPQLFEGLPLQPNQPQQLG
jgi:N12 class adenine-specific DNA methylase